MTRNDPVETVESDTNNGSELDEECDAGNSNDEDGDDGPVGPCHIGDLTSQIKWDCEEMQAGFAMNLLLHNTMDQVEIIPE